MYSGTPLDIKKKFIVLLQTLSAYNSLLVRYKVYSSDHRECLSTIAKGMVKPLKILVLIEYHVERILLKKNLSYQSVSPYC